MLRVDYSDVQWLLSAMIRRVRLGRMTVSSWPTQPDGHDLRFGELGPQRQQSAPFADLVA
jgi:hypothetical protein